MKVPLYDVVSGAGFLLLLVGLLVFAGLSIDAPPYFVDAFKISIGAFGRSGIAVANEYRHRAPTP